MIQLIISYMCTNFFTYEYKKRNTIMNHLYTTIIVGVVYKCYNYRKYNTYTIPTKDDTYHIKVINNRGKVLNECLSYWHSNVK